MLPLMLKILLRSDTSRLLGTKNERTGILKLSICTWTRDWTDPVTAHMWSYKHFLSQFGFHLAWHQWRVIVCTGISSCICSQRCWNHQGYCVSVAIFAMCDVTANQPGKIFAEWNFRGWPLIRENRESLTLWNLKRIRYIRPPRNA